MREEILIKNKFVYVVIAVIAGITVVSAITFSGITVISAEAKYSGVTREFYIFSVVD